VTASTVSRTVHLAAGLVPATLIVLFSGIIALIALALGTDRRQYALDLADRFADLAAVLVGANRPPPRNRTAGKPLPHAAVPSPAERQALPERGNRVER
jgi:hypothetical protein